MAAEIDALLVAMRKWRKAVRKLTKKPRSPAQREAQLEQAEKNVLAHLARAAVTQELNELIEAAIAPDSLTPQAVRQTLRQEAEPLVKTELKSVHPLAVSQRDLEKVINTFLQTPDAAKPVKDSDEILAAFVELSNAITAGYEASVELSRRRKKQRRRDLMLGTLQTTLGIGLLAGNTQLDPAVANSSYILGGNALLLALQNLVGQQSSRGTAD